MGQVFIRQIDSNLGVLQWALLMLLCSCLQHFQTRQFHHISLSNLFYSTMTFVCAVLRIIVLMNWEIMCKTCSKHIVKYSQTLYYLLEVIFFLAVVILNLFLYLLEPLYKTCLHPRSLSRFSLVQYFWNLASKVFLSTVMVTCLLLYFSILLNLTTNQTLVWAILFPFT